MKLSKILVFLIALVMPFALTACSAKPVSSTNTDSTPSSINNVSSQSETDSSEDSKSDDSSKASITSTEDMEELLIMPNAKNVMSNGTSILFNTDDSAEDAIDFYNNAIEELNGKGTTVDSTVGDIVNWEWSGTYPGGTLDILIGSNPSTAGLVVAISYT